MAAQTERLGTVWRGEDYYTGEPRELEIMITRGINPKTSHRCAIGGERFKSTYTGYGFALKGERRAELIVRACETHTPELQEKMAALQEELPELLFGSTDPIDRLSDILSERRFHL